MATNSYFFLFFFWLMTEMGGDLQETVSSSTGNEAAAGFSKSEFELKAAAYI